MRLMLVEKGRKFIMDLMELFEIGRKDCWELYKMSPYYFDIYMDLMDGLYDDEKKVLVQEGIEAFKKLGIKPISKTVTCDYDHVGDRAYEFAKYTWQRRSA